MKILFWIITLPILALAAAFAAANPQAVTLRLWPFAYEAEVPVYAAVLVAFGAGLLIAGLYGWIANLGVRWDRRRHVRHEKKLEEEAETLRSELNEARRPPAIAPEEAEARRRIVASDGT